ncbi:bis(5'-nucleosyl)-tetraphosphatase (symmetrical) YqeK [uncultured Selenomonas sp.]|uniref:bis(5'-nucleosyl)-tetraphosphatase (symmetrical) YqeK n=1 Tax=uncultured Selenomonas sp. TaxID=159275 RepID=UPI0025F9BA03|nr:bis(5'-nucleosyl)-tetraphosphatase (symmetrical) YqeK [uncultured Selenomonas sp.]
MSMSYEQRKALLESRLKPSRFRHSLGVADTAAFLAERFGVDVEQARLAGLLHDCAREFPNDAMMAEADQRHIAYGPVERAMPLLLHAYLGAARVRECYEVEDDAICQAIYRHTVGAPQMTRLDKIIWFADMIEPNREYPEVEMLRKLSQEASLDEMLLVGLTESIKFVCQKGTMLHPSTISARNELLLKGVTSPV